MLRRTIRRLLAIGIILFAWYAASQVASNAADAVPLATVSAALLLLLVFALSRKRRA